jgi:hypothetical protein
MNDEQEKKDERLPVYRHRWLRSLVCGMVILMCGMVIGGSAVGWFVHARVMELIHTPEIVPEHITEAMERRLGLTEQQADEVLAIYNKYLERFLERRRQLRPQVEADIEALHSEITAVLSPEQNKKWSKRFEKIKSIILPDN